MGAAITFIILVPVLGQVILKMGSLTCIGLVFLLPRLLNIGFQGGRSPLSFLMALAVGMVCCKKDVFAWFHSWVPFGSRYAGGFLKFVLLAALVGISKLSASALFLLLGIPVCIDPIYPDPFP